MQKFSTIRDLIASAGPVVFIVIGVLVGHFFPHTGEALKPLGDGFIKLVKMIIAPVIFLPFPQELLE